MGGARGVLGGGGGAGGGGGLGGGRGGGGGLVAYFGHGRAVVGREGDKGDFSEVQAGNGGVRPGLVFGSVGGKRDKADGEAVNDAVLDKLVGVAGGLRVRETGFNLDTFGGFGGLGDQANGFVVTPREFEACRVVGSVGESAGRDCLEVAGRELNFDAVGDGEAAHGARLGGVGADGEGAGLEVSHEGCP